MTLESVDDVERGDGLALGVLSVGDSVTNDTLKEGLQDTTGLLVDHCDAVSTCQSDDDVVNRNLLAEIRLTPPRRARRRMAGFVIP